MKPSLSVEDLLKLPFEDALRSSAALRKYVEDDVDAEDLREEFAVHWHPRDAPADLRRVLSAILVERPVLTATELLSLPFGEALAACPGLTTYIGESGDPMELQEELRAHWGPGAPSELREVLDEVLASGDDAAAAMAAEAASQAPAPAARHSPRLLGPPGGAGEVEDCDDIGPLAEELAGRGLSAHDTRRALGSAATMLSRPFEAALRGCPGLQAHFNAQGSEVQAVEDAFREHWGLEAPPEMVSIIEQILEAAAEPKSRL